MEGLKFTSLSNKIAKIPMYQTVKFVCPYVSSLLSYLALNMADSIIVHPAAATYTTKCNLHAAAAGRTIVESALFMSAYGVEQFNQR